MARRAALRQRLRNELSAKSIDESCIPSYCHGNVVASAVAWWRLLAACRLYKKYAHTDEILDFGASTGELLSLLGGAFKKYHFIEKESTLASELAAEHASAVRKELSRLQKMTYSAIFCLDSLEHNTDIEGIICRLRDALRTDGVLIVSGPTENLLYKIGRFIAGFDGHYHRTNIFEIEELLQSSFELREKIIGPIFLPLFSVSVWKLKAK